VKALLESPVRTLLAGAAVTVLLIVLWLATGSADVRGVLSVLLRFIHVVAAMAWIGLIFYVNFIQFAALDEADEATRRAISQSIVPRVLAAMSHASHLTVLSGAILLIATGYVLGEWIYSSAVFMPSPRTALLVAGAAGGIVMWSILAFGIRPGLAIALGRTGADDGAKADARRAVKLYARVNLALALPVTFAMVAAAHLA
jgi:uncharacterized membrane protein